MISDEVKKNSIPLLVTATVIVITFLLFNDLEFFFSNLLNDVSARPDTYALVSFLVLASDIVLPVPSSVVMYLNGYVLGSITGAIVSLVSLLISSIIGYYIGKLTSLALKTKSGKNAHALLSKYGALSILITRGIPILSESICMVCGYNNVPFKQYFILNLVGYIPPCLLYAICGSLGYDKSLFFASFGCSLLISATFWFLGKKYLVIHAKANEE